MNFRFNKSSITFASLLIVFLSNFIQKSLALKCFDCVDSINGDCTDPFDLKKRDQFSIDCDDTEHLPKDASGTLKFERSVGCRKIIQNVEGNVSVVRECAYSGQKTHGMKRMGNRGVRIFYYQCDTNACNVAKTPGTVDPASVVFLFLSLLVPALMML